MSNKLFEDIKKKYPIENKEIKDIILDTLEIKEITPEEKKYMEQFQKVQVFSFNMTKLKSLNNLPYFPELSKIELSDNFISGEELSKLNIYTKIKKIRLANNKIKNFEDIKCFSNFKELKFLDLSENPINSIDSYRKQIFELIPSLNFLDMQDKEGNSYSDFEEEEDENEEKENEEEEEKDEESFIISDKEKENKDEEIDDKDEEDINDKNDNKNSKNNKNHKNENEDDDFYKPEKKRKLQ